MLKPIENPHLSYSLGDGGTKQHDMARSIPAACVCATEESSPSASTRRRCAQTPLQDMTKQKHVQRPSIRCHERDSEGGAREASWKRGSGPSHHPSIPPWKHASARGAPGTSKRLPAAHVPGSHGIYARDSSSLPCDVVDVGRVVAVMAPVVSCLAGVVQRGGEGRYHEFLLAGWLVYPGTRGFLPREASLDNVWLLRWLVVSVYGCSSRGRPGREPVRRG